MKKDKIYIQQWLEFHPYEKPLKSDYYYLELCNKVDEVLQIVEHSLFKDNIEQNRKDLACVLICWFEDLVSDFGLWNAFTRKHHEMYGKYIPFYETDDYFDGEINPQDISFLIWHFLSVNYYDDFIYSPSTKFNEYASLAIYDIFDEEWDDAPVNTKLQDLKNMPADTDFYTIRDTIGWIILDSYLFYKYGRDNELNKKEALDDLLEDERLKHELDENYIMGILYGIQDDAINNTITHLLALKGKDWLAMVLGDTHPLYSPLLEMSDKIYGVFLFLGKDDQHINVRHVASGTKIGVQSETVLTDNLVPEESVIIMGIIKWKDEWLFTGSFMADKMNDKILQSEKSDLRKVGLFTSDKIKKEHILEQYEHFLEYNHNKPLVFLRNHMEQEEFINGFFEFLNQKIARETDEQDNRDLIPKDFLPSQDEDENDKNLILFFNRETGIEIATGIALFIPDKENPCYEDGIETEKFTEHILYNYSISHELAKYLIKNYDLPALYFIEKTDSYLIHENLDFILRFNKRESYHAKPLLTMVG